jgi:hypothetical protein
MPNQSFDIHALKSLVLMIVVVLLVAIALVAISLLRPVNTTWPLTFRACFNTHHIAYRLDDSGQNLIPVNAYNDMMVENVCM